MEIYRILDELEAEIEESARIPLTNKAVIQDEILYKYIDRLRANLPEDIRQAQWVKKERQRILDDAEAEAQRILDNVKIKVAELANETEVYKLAEKNSREIMEKAKLQSQEITQGALGYADEVISQLQSQLEKYLTTIKEGRQQIKQSVKTKPSNKDKQTP